MSNFKQLTILLSSFISLSLTGCSKITIFVMPEAAKFNLQKKLSNAPLNEVDRNLNLTLSESPELVGIADLNVKFNIPPDYNFSNKEITLRFNPSDSSQKQEIITTFTPALVKSHAGFPKIPAGISQLEIEIRDTVTGALDTKDIITVKLFNNEITTTTVFISKDSGGSNTSNPSSQPISPPPESSSPAPPLIAQPVKTPTSKEGLSLSLSPSTVTLAKQGDQFQLIARVQNQNGEFLDPSEFTLEWSSDKPAEISVNSTGLVKAEVPTAFATITVKVSGTDLSATALIKMGSAGDLLAPPPPGDSDIVQGIIDFS